MWFDEADRVGLGVELQALAIRRALVVAADAGLPEGAFLSVNVSPAFLDDPAIRSAFSTADLSRIVIEITEDEPVEDYARLRLAMAHYL